MIQLICVIVFCIFSENLTDGEAHSKTESMENKKNALHADYVTNNNTVQDFRNSYQEVTYSNKLVTNSYKEGTNSYQEASNSYQEVTNYDQEVTNSYQEVINSYQEVTNHDQEVTNFDYKVTSSFEEGTYSNQEITSSIQGVASSFEGVTNSYRGVINSTQDNSYQEVASSSQEVTNSYPEDPEVGNHANETLNRNPVVGSFTTDMYVQLSISAFGVLGNTLSLAILHRQNLSKLPCLFYMKVLTLSDIIYLFFLNFAGLQGLTSYLITSHPFACKLGNYFSIISRLYPKYIVLAISVERFIVVLFPLRACSLPKKRYARVYVVSALAYLLIVCVPVIPISGISSQEDSQPSTCFLQTYTYPVLHKVIKGTGLFNHLLPGLVILISNVCMSVKLAYYRVSRKRLTGNSQSLQQKGSGTNALLLTVGISQLVLVLPQAMILALVVDILEADPVPLYFTLAKAMYYMNYAGDFLLYTVGGSIIRKEIMLIFSELIQRCRQS